MKECLLDADFSSCFPNNIPCVCSRLEAISGDAELQEKSHSDLHRLGVLIQEKCEKAMKEYEMQQENGGGADENNPDGKIAIIQINSVTG